MAAARMSLRPTLFLVRQELRNSAKMLLGDSMIELLVGHLNATIVGTIDDFVKQAQGKLSGILADAGNFGASAVNDIAKGLEAVVNGKHRRKRRCARRESESHCCRQSIA